MKKKEQLRFIYGFLIVILVLLALFFFFRTHLHYNQFRSHRAYFRQPNPEIQPWMTVSSVMKRFNISKTTMAQELKVNVTSANYRFTLDSLCKKNHLNCSDVVIHLNYSKSK